MQSAAPAPETTGPPTDGPTIDELVEIGLAARAAGNHAAITDPETIRAIRLRIEAATDGRGAWRRVLRRIRSGR